MIYWGLLCIAVIGASALITLVLWAACTISGREEDRSDG